MTQPSRATTTPDRDELAGILRLWPLYALLFCAMLVLAGPTWRAVRVAMGGGAQGGVQVDTSGASGGFSGSRYVLDLPIEIINGGSGLVHGVSLWVDTFGCPAEDTPLAGCRRLTSFEQYVPARVQPGSIDRQSQRMNGVAPRDGEVLRIRRKLQAIDDGMQSGQE